jgi:hypothetical protein
MSNPLFNALGGGMPQGNGPMQMIQQFMQFKQNFKGDPKAEVEKMLQSGRISQQQLNQVQQMAAGGLLFYSFLLSADGETTAGAIMATAVDMQPQQLLRQTSREDLTIPL